MGCVQVRLRQAQTFHKVVVRLRGQPYFQDSRRHLRDLKIHNMNSQLLLFLLAKLELLGTAAMCGNYTTLIPTYNIIHNTAE